MDCKPFLRQIRTGQSYGPLRGGGGLDSAVRPGLPGAARRRRDRQVTMLQQPSGHCTPHPLRGKNPPGPQAAQGANRFHPLRILHPFGDSRSPQRVHQVHSGFYHHLAVGIIDHVADERPVHLDFPDGQAVEEGEGEITGAEAAERDRLSQLRNGHDGGTIAFASETKARSLISSRRAFGWSRYRCSPDSTRSGRVGSNSSRADSRLPRAGRCPGSTSGQPARTCAR